MSPAAFDERPLEASMGHIPMSTTISLAVPSTASDATTSPTCESCAHPVSSHDIIARRYCRATADSALIRACICKNGQN